MISLTPQPAETLKESLSLWDVADNKTKYQDLQ